MDSTSGSRPGTGIIVCGATVIGLSAARLASGWNPGPGWLVYESACWLVGGALGLWGWSRLRRAKAAHPHLPWREFLHTELIGLGVAVVLMVTLAAMPPELRDELTQAVRGLADAVGAARGRP